MFKTFALSFIFMGLTLQACGQGCLKCNAQNTCIVCDISTYYYLSNGSCVLTAANNCSIVKMNGDCFACASGYYIDNNTKKCVSVPTAKVVAQCNAYDGSQNCVACNTGFYVSNANCTAVNTTVANCNLYTANGKCGVCATGYIFSVDGTACVATPAISNCGSYTYLSCNTCGSGYINNANSYFTAFNTSASAVFENLFLTSYSKATNWQALSVCQAITATNCASYKTYNQCAVCSTGYFLNSVGTCTAFPLAIIDGCAIYSNANTCTTCVATKRLVDATGKACVDNTVVTNCLTYNPSAVGATICVACTSGFYLQSGACSTARTISANIQNCATTVADADRCSSCATGYQVTTDGSKCLAAISSCAAYGQTSSSSTVQTCTACNNGFYLNSDNSGCTAGTIANCLVYGSSSTCTTCDNTSFLNGSVCTKHQVISNCSTYSGSNQNTCTSCNAGFYPLALTQVCSTATSIQYCIAFTFNVGGVLTCNTCKAGYYLTTVNTCLPIPATQIGCQTYNGASSTCTLCSPGYLLVYGGKCALPFQFLSLNCQTFTTGTVANGVTTASLQLVNDANPTSVGSCATCKAGNVPYSYADSFACIEYSQLTNVFGAATVSASCARFVDMAGTISCAECYDSFVNIAGTCTAYTSSTTAPCTATNSYLVADDIRNGVVNKCFTGSGSGIFNNCAVVARYDLTASATETGVSARQADFTCVQPKNGNVFTIGDLYTEATLNIPYATVNPVMDSSSGTATPRYATSISPILLYKRYTDFTVTTLATLIPNCELYATLGSANQCIKCNQGYTAVITTTGTSTCAAITGCDGTVVMGGLRSVMNKLLSCHSCSGTTLPTLSMTTSIVSSKRVWTYVAPAATYSTNACSTPPNSLITGCAAVGIDTTQPSTFCIACKPSYTATYATASSTLLAEQITACTPVTNCASSGNLAFNSCTNCGVDASNNQYAANDYTFQSCVTINTANCMVKSGTVCDLCDPGYFLNYNNICERLVLPYCSDTVQSDGLTYTSTVGDYPKLIAYYSALRAGGSSASGCRRCSGNQGTDSTSFVGLKFANPVNGCVQSSYVTTVSVIAGTLGYISSCQQYANTVPASNALLTCAACNTGFIPKYDGSACVTAVTNCITADSTTPTRCAVCNANFVLTSGQCLAMNINNCATYDGSSGTLLCATCNSGYYLGANNNNCVLGSVLNCRSYTAQSATSCTACVTGFTLVSSGNSGTYCMPVDTSYNCNTMDSGSSSGVGLQYKQYVCTSCATSDTTSYNLVSYTPTATTPSTICASLNSIANCATYSVVPTSTFSTNTFACSACNTGFYLSATGFACIARINISSSCSVYDPSADACSTCNSFTFLSADKTSCVAFPNGILGCNIYSNSTVCTTCNTPRYLSNNTCLLSPVITNCALYSGNNTCSACSSGFFLTNSTYCQAATAQNCLTYQSISACATCGPNMGLQTTNSIINCVSNTVSNCITATTVSPFTCTQCSTGYYANAQGVCASVSALITNCNLYDSATTCISCNSGFALASNKTACTNSYLLSSDANCAVTTLLAAPTCSQCALGSYFVNGTCTTCSNNTASSGCLTCDPTNQSTCFACMSGYYQQANGTCVRVSGQTTSNNNGNTTTVTTKSASLTSVLGLLVLLFVSLF